MKRDPNKLFAATAVEVEHRPDGSSLLRSPMELATYPRCVGERLVHWANTDPECPFLMQRDPDGVWRGVTYAEALKRVERLAAGMLRGGLSSQRPLMILSDNSVAHGLLMLAAMHVGIPSVSVSSAYSLVSLDQAKLRQIVELVRPGLVFAEQASRYARAFDSIRRISDATFVTGGSDSTAQALDLASLETENAEAVAEAYRAIGPDTVAKLLFTSGSTGEPKGVINTQRMLCSNQQARAQLWPFLRKTPPVYVDWLPWSHTFGGNFNFNCVLWHGGTLYIDGGRPAPGLFEQTIENLRDIQPTVYLNVPRGFDMLVTALRSDRGLRERFFSRLQVIFYAAAALPQNLWDALQELALQTVGARIPQVSAWGSTETAPLATDCYFQAERSGVIGLPIPGTVLKLVPNGAKREVRVRGPNVTPGYWRRPDLTANAFDDEGFYCTGDAVRLLDENAPERGVLFDGRVSEDFKLDSGTWVNVGMLRIRAIAALAPIAQDIVITGHDRAEIGFLIFPNLSGCRQLCADLRANASIEDILESAQVRARVAEGLAHLRAEGQGSSTFATRAILFHEPPSIDASEITDKGYINQRAVLSHRATFVDAIYARPAPRAVIAIPQ